MARGPARCRSRFLASDATQLRKTGSSNPVKEHAPQLEVEVRDVAAGLWIWRLEHPRWKPGQGWEPVVASTCVESRGETLVLDPVAPPAGATEVAPRDGPGACRARLSPLVVRRRREKFFFPPPSFPPRRRYRGVAAGSRTNVS